MLIILYYKVQQLCEKSSSVGAGAEVKAEISRSSYAHAREVFGGL